MFLRLSLFFFTASGLTLYKNETEESFKQFVSQHRRAYLPGSDEYKMRFEFFRSHMAEVAAHNAASDKKWTAVVNRLADRSPQELKGLRGYDRKARVKSGGAVQHAGSGFASLFAKSARRQECADWTHLDSIKKVEDQQMCGSCWAFAAVKAMEAHSELMGSAKSFSYEEVVACTPNPRKCGGTGGCEGATSELAFQYALGAGLSTADQVPYTGAAGLCQRPANNQVSDIMETTSDGFEKHTVGSGNANMALSYGGQQISMIGWVHLPSNDLNAVMLALTHNGPVAVGVSAGASWNMYGAGIFSKGFCTPDAIVDHAVVLVGYGRDSEGDKFWRLQNSWGPEWGENGYIRLQRDNDEAEAAYCGMDNDPQVGIACEGETEPVRVCGTCAVLYDVSMPIFAETGPRKQASTSCD